ncbi:MAG: ROK family transcriptional regulator [Oscillospiraceae bacterium]|jgi:predicted NBD/HSP70 family sugar kinase|nr:ROK family transcriptional regulator [Oscillospiraceae bacterium]
MKELRVPVTERRRITRNRIYNLIYESRLPLSKLEISQTLGLSLPTVYQNITELLNAGLIEVGQVQRSRGGRRPVGYSVVSNVKFAVGISITAGKLRFLASDLKLKELAYKNIAIESFESEDIGKQVAKELEKFLDANRLHRNRMLGVGITMPAVMDEEKDEVKLSPTLRMHNISLSTIREPIPYTTHIENDGNSGGFAEWFESRHTVGSNIAYLYLENGVGGTVFINGAQYFGENKRSGEFGHMCVEPNGLLCNCGKRGCLEAYCSALRISKKLGITVEEFFNELKKGNNVDYQVLWQDVLEHLAIGINNIHVMLDCDIILGGFLSQYLEPYMPELKRLVAEKDTFEDNADYVKLCRYPHRADMMGVAWYYIKDYIEKI